MALRVETDMLYQPNHGPLPISAKGFVDTVVSELLNSEVSIVECIRSLLRWVSQGEVVSLFGVILYAVFVVGLTVLDVGILFMIAFRLCPLRHLSIAKVLKKLAMLDV